MDDDDGNIFSQNIVILLVAMGSAAFVVSMYHVITICWCNQRMTDQNPPQPLPPTENTPSVADMIPIYTYHKKKVDHTAVSSGDEDDEGGTCAVCLGDYEEGEELKMMPECMHSFHVPCIDMWLSSHSSCPICRSSATPSLEVHHSSDHDLSYSYHHHSIDMTQFTNGFVLRR